ncbi:hypothetical protein RV01_GL001622 [Enterococcus dispar]|nr:hypothetical protein RV01_GL001622 [Enterococcus dispar]
MQAFSYLFIQKCYNWFIRIIGGNDMTDELQQHLDKGRYGTPLVNPDEQHKYMGTFRERCYLSMTIAQMKSDTDKDNFLTELKKHEDATVLLNGQMSESLQAEYIQLATKNHAKFTVVNDFVDANPDSFGLLLVAKEAVNEPVIDVEKKYPEETKTTEKKEPEKKHGFFDRLFH